MSNYNFFCGGRYEQILENIPAGFAYTDMDRSPFTEQMLLCYNVG